MARRLFVSFFAVVLLVLGFAQLSQTTNAAPHLTHQPPVVAQATTVPGPTPTPRVRDRPPPPDIIERLRPTVNLAGIVGTLTIIVVLLASVYFHRAYRTRKTNR